MQVWRKSSKMKSTDIEHTLGECEFFEELKPGEIKIVAEICQVKTYETGECIYRQGDFGEHLYIIAEGRVILERSMKIGPREGRVVIAILGKGKVFGCWSTLLSEPHVMMLTTFCQTPSTILVLKGADLRGLMIRDTDFGFNLMEKLCFMLRERIQAVYGAMEKI